MRSLEVVRQCPRLYPLAEKDFDDIEFAERDLVEEEPAFWVLAFCEPAPWAAPERRAELGAWAVLEA
jgi:hypothetical protein